MSALSHQKFVNQEWEDVAYFEPFYLKDFMITKKQ
jgi:tRNA threonylcarbamoyladenosine biosynthesis protein TsaB